MSNNININSKEWCDFIFKNRNKAYGAYKLRQSSAKDHLAAFGVTILFTAIVSIYALTMPREIEGDDSFRGCIFTILPEVDIPDVANLPPPPPPIAPPKMHFPSAMFSPPEITPDDKIIKVIGNDKNGVLYEEDIPIIISYHLSSQK